MHRGLISQTQGGHKRVTSSRRLLQWGSRGSGSAAPGVPSPIVAHEDCKSLILSPLSSSVSHSPLPLPSSLSISASDFFFPFLSLFLCVCVFPYASLIPLYFHLDLSEALIPLSSPSSCVTVPLPVCVYLSLSVCESFFLSPSQTLSTPPSLPLCLGLSLFLLPPPSPFCIIRPAPTSSQSQPSSRGSGSGRGGSSGAAELDWGIESRLSRGQPTALGPCACWGCPARNSRQRGQGEVPP